MRVLKSPACAGQTHIFFPRQYHADHGEDEQGCQVCPGGCGICQSNPVDFPLCEDCHSVEALERASEQQSKQMCLSCPEIDACLSNAQESAAAVGDFSLGVVAGLNRWEHRWLMQADAAQKEKLEALRNDLGSDGCLNLRAWFEASGPKVFSSTYPAEIANEHGVPPSVARRWLTAAQVEPLGVRPRNEATQAVLHLLSDNEWHNRAECLRVACEAIPEERALEKAERRNISTVAARNAIAQSVLRERARYDQIDQRVFRGERQIRLKLMVI